MDSSKDQDELTEEEAAKRRDEALKRALTAPPKPRKSKTKKAGSKRGGAETNSDQKNTEE